MERKHLGKRIHSGPGSWALFRAFRSILSSSPRPNGPSMERRCARTLWDRCRAMPSVCPSLLSLLSRLKFGLGGLEAGSEPLARINPDNGTETGRQLQNAHSYRPAHSSVPYPNPTMQPHRALALSEPWDDHSMLMRAKRKGCLCPGNLPEPLADKSGAGVPDGRAHFLSRFLPSSTRSLGPTVGSDLSRKLGSQDFRLHSRMIRGHRLQTTSKPGEPNTRAQAVRALLSPAVVVFRGREGEMVGAVEVVSASL